MSLDIFSAMYMPQSKTFAISWCLAWCRSAFQFFAFQNCSKRTLCAISGFDLPRTQRRQSLHLPFHCGCRQGEVQEDTQVDCHSKLAVSIPVMLKALGARHLFGLHVGSLPQWPFLVCFFWHAKASDPTYCQILRTMKRR